MASSRVAIYWDFENVHAAVVESGGGDYRAGMNRPQPAVVDVAAIAGFARSLGDIAINRAYADWLRLGAYRQRLQVEAVDLVQLFHIGRHGKNGADIRLSLDALQDLTAHRHVTHLVVVSGDSDFVALAQKARTLGATVIGVGVESSTSTMWVAACDQFKFYRTLLAKQGDAEELAELRKESDVAEARALLLRAVRLGAAQSPSGWMVKAAVKPAMTRLDPTFDESAYGYGSFGELLAAAADGVVEQRRGAFDIELRPANAAAGGGEAASPLPSDPAGIMRAALRKTGLRLPEPPVLRAYVAALPGVAEEYAIPDMASMDARMAAALGLAEVTPEVRKCRNILYRARAFRRAEDEGVDLVEHDADRLLTMAIDAVAARLEAVDDPDPAVLSQLLLGSPDPADVERCRVALATVDWTVEAR